MKNLLNKFSSFSLNEKKILIVITSLFFPIYISIPCLILIVFSFLFDRQNGLFLFSNRVFICAYLFCFLEIIVSFFYQNWIGFGNAIGIFFAFIFVFICRKYVSSDFFDFILDFCIVISIFVSIYGLFEFNYLSNLKGYSFFDFHIQNSPKGRIHIFFWNANIYATMIEFIVVACMYRWTQNDKLSSKIVYVFVGMLNLGMLYLTGCRAAYIPLAIILPIFFLIYGDRRWIFVSFSIMFLGLLTVLFVPSLLPRLQDFSTIQSRFKIWCGALQGIMMFPFFGNGPQTYGLLYPIYHWHKAPHAHNIFIDSILSYGIIGTILLLIYVINLFKELFEVKTNRAFLALMVSFWIVILVHGFVDCTLNFISTGVLGLFILNASCYQKNFEVH